MIQGKLEAAIDSKELALGCAKICLERKAEAVTVLDVGNNLAIADFFVLATGRNKRHLKSLADEIRVLARAGRRRAREEGTGDTGGRWVLIDLGDVIVHLFDSETRDYYDIDGLWADAPRIDVKV